MGPEWIHGSVRERRRLEREYRDVYAQLRDRVVEGERLLALVRSRVDEEPDWEYAGRVGETRRNVLERPIHRVMGGVDIATQLEYCEGIVEYAEALRLSPFARLRDVRSFDVRHPPTPDRCPVLGTALETLAVIASGENPGGAEMHDYLLAYRRGDAVHDVGDNPSIALGKRHRRDGESAVFERFASADGEEWAGRRYSYVPAEAIADFAVDSARAAERIIGSIDRLIEDDVGHLRAMIATVRDALTGLALAIEELEEGESRTDLDLAGERSENESEREILLAQIYGIPSDSSKP